MQQISKFFSSSRVWTVIIGALVVATVFVGVSFFLPNSSAKAKEPMNLLTYEPQAQRDANSSAPESGTSAQVVAAEPVEVAQAQQQVAQVAVVSAAPAQGSAGKLSYAGEIQAAKKVPVAVEV